MALNARLLSLAGGDTSDARARAILDAVTRTLAARGISSTTAADLSGKSPIVGFLRAHDLGFRIRRLRLLARRLTELDETADDAVLAPVREAIYASLADYLEQQRSDRHKGLRDMVHALRDDAAPLIDALGRTMDLTAIDARTDAALSHGLSRLPKDLRRPLLLAYLGFPFFDIATLPMLQGEGIDEFDPVRVDRISPDDATAIREGGAAATLKGIQFHNFGAFFSRAYRENDYLWGRLHGADRLVDIVVSTLPQSARLKPGRIAAIKHRAFVAILDEEEPRLTAIPGLFHTLREEIG